VRTTLAASGASTIRASFRSGGPAVGRLTIGCRGCGAGHAFDDDNLARRPRTPDPCVVGPPLNLLKMIIHESSYRRWLAARGVGDRDRAASSPASYVSYLNSVSDLLGEAVSPTLVSGEADVQDILARLDGLRSSKTIANYGSALRQYAAMVRAGAHP
jgi:hypothetical protein